jgi:hypothetical protein
MGNETPAMNAEAVVEDGCIVIRLAIKNLSMAVEGAYALGAIDAPMTVTDADEFANDVVSALNDEDEEGTTLVHQMFDKAFNHIGENGSLGIAVEDEIG